MSCIFDVMVSRERNRTHLLVVEEWRLAVGTGLTGESLGTSPLSLTVIWKEEVGAQVSRV